MKNLTAPNNQKAMVTKKRYRTMSQYIGS